MELLIDRVIVANGDVEIRYVIPTSPSSEKVRFCHLRSDYFNGPDVMRLRRRHAAQQIGIAPMLGIPPAEVRAGTDAGDPHLAHMALHRLAVDNDRSYAVGGLCGIVRA